jgi:DNA-binding CsgD family transcriptional regulator
MTDTNVIEMTTASERDQQVLGLRLAGISTSRIARELGLGAKDVAEALERALPVVDASYRSRILREELARLDQLQSWWYGAAKTSAPAAAIVLKIAERRACMLALDAPQHVRLDPVQIVAGGEPQPNETAAMIAALDWIVAERAEPEPPSEPAA